MTALTVILGASLGTVLGTGALTLANLRRYRWRAAPDLPQDLGASHSLVSVCVPARNEEANIEACVRSLLAQDWPAIEVLVYDDQSNDRTPEILAGLAAADERVRRVATQALPEGWNGKQHACWRMAQAAGGRWLLFTDADVRFEPGCVRRAVQEAEARGVGLISTFPRQIVGSPGEALLVPMIFFLLFSYLPMGRMRTTRDPSASAGCGQFLLVRSDVYAASGGHASFRDSMHDGIKMPRQVRRAGFATDLFDATDLCSVRMYRGWRQTWRGFAKNAYEGLGSVGLLVFLTALHAVAHVLPWLVVPMAGLLLAAPPAGRWPLGLGDPLAVALAAATIGAGVAQRLVLASAFRHPMGVGLFHPISVALMGAVQWHSYLLHISGKRSWRGRVQGKPGVVPGG